MFCRPTGRVRVGHTYAWEVCTVFILPAREVSRIWKERNPEMNSQRTTGVYLNIEISVCRDYLERLKNFTGF